MARDWVEALSWILIVAIPMILAGTGLRKPSALAWAAGVSLPLLDIPGRSDPATPSPGSLLSRGVYRREAIGNSGRMSWKRRAAILGSISGVLTFLLLAPFECHTEFMRFVPGGWDTESVTTSCKGLVAFSYWESRELVGPRMPEGGELPRPSLSQPQTLVTATIVGTLVGLITWLVGGRPQVGMPAAISMLLIAVTFVAATSPGGAVIYAAPVLIPLFWWMAYQGNLLARIAWAILASLVVVEALALATYGSSGFGITAGLLVVGLSSGVAVLTAKRWRAVRHREFPNL